MRKKRILFLAFLFLSLAGRLEAQQRPKLIVGLVVDQMRYDFLYRYSNRYGQDGFKRLLKEGFSCENAFIPYTPTYTAAGHSCVFTGSVPSMHGIMGNNWYSRELKKVVYCTDDNEVQGVGSNSAAGKMSPKNMWSSTITDELRIASNFKNKTIAVALKDRGAILPGGHTANAAYWFDNSTGGWITSTFYMNTLPDWVNKFNARKLPDTYLKQNWNSLYPLNTYTQSTPDAKPYEGKLGGGDNVFPHITESITANQYEVFRNTPYGNTYTFEMGKAAIEGEQLGTRGVTDFLALSFSSPDYAGHTFGPNSIELEDMYLRLDRDLARFLNYLDGKVGKGQYLIFLTADHGAAHVPGYMKENRLPAGVLFNEELRGALTKAVSQEFGVAGIIEQFINYQIYLDTAVINRNKLNTGSIKAFLINQLLKHPGVSQAFDLHALPYPLPDKVQTMVKNGFNQKLSGDIQFIPKPNWFEGWGTTGTTHGTWNPYDAHIPLVWFGWNIKPGKMNREVYMSDIAPTLAAMLRVQMPNAAVGDVIEELVK